MRCLVLRLLALLLLVATAPGPAAGFDLLVVSGGSDQVLRFDGATGAFLSVFDEVTDPRGIATDGAGLVYVSNMGGLVIQYQEDGTLLDFLFTDLGPISCLVIGPDGVLYASLFFDDRVVRISFAVDPPAVLGDFVTAGSGGLDGPAGLAFGPDGDLFVSSRITGQVLRYDGTTGAPVGVFATPSGNGPEGLTFGPDGDLYVANSTTKNVLRFDGDTGAALGVFADPIGTSGGGMDPVFGPDGRLYLNVTVDEQIERFDGTSGASQGVFIAGGSGGMADPHGFVIVPEPGAAASALLAMLALAALRSRRS